MHMLYCVLHRLLILAIHSAPRLSTRQWLPRTKCTNHFLPSLALSFLLASLKSSWDWVWVAQRLASQDMLSTYEVGIVAWADHRERVFSPVCFWGSHVDLLQPDFSVPLWTIQISLIWAVIWASWSFKAPLSSLWCDYHYSLQTPFLGTLAYWTLSTGPPPTPLFLDLSL